MGTRIKTQGRARPASAAAVAILVLLAAALGMVRWVDDGSQAAVGGSARAARARTVSPPAPLAQYHEKAPHVDSQMAIYGVQGAVQGAPTMPPPDLPPVAAAAFRAPVARYLTYSTGQLSLMIDSLSRLQRALAADDRTAAQRAWLATYADYLHLGAVYLEGRLATLDQEIDGTSTGLSGGTDSPRFSGLHRLEFGLWTGAPLSSLQPWTHRLVSAVGQLRRVLPHLRISPLDYATRAHEILEDAVRDLLSGADVPWSGAGVVGTDAAVVATTEVLKTLRPVLGQREGLMPVVKSDLNGLRAVLTSIRRDHGGTLPSNDELTRLQSSRLDAAIGQALEGLAQLPGALEVVNATAPPAIPARAVRMDR